MKEIWNYLDPVCAKDALENWCRLAYESNLPPVITFADKLKRYEEGILNHCYYPISTGKLEGTNNKIKVIHRNAYGFHDLRYFILKARQAFS